ncbi:hypothetical protein MFERI14815_00167 [Mycoplasma feriruminatoris]|uniref:BspA family leucine-rich repeat surface protein n=1 Tax=Mycoplasma feriruminatoris TaxID=1179777 RepID=UPI00241FB549|nr:BspA family leucine-rich repeat surface protein [Mycoplasma feriruminatoris]WFQ91571.1 hypothetical protein MFERI14815_00167 [Mycoplasma feriruminatoris]
MKKLLTILTSTSAVFLITAGVMVVNRNNNFNSTIFFNSQKREKPHKTDGHRLIEIGYYWDSYEKQTRIRQIPPEIKTIAAQLPPEINSLKGAFQTVQNNINWEVQWNTKNIINMNSMFYNTTWFNSDAILKWDTSNVTDMGEMFAYAAGFNQDLSGWDVSKVKNFGKMFEGAKEYNNGGQYLNWKDKLKSATNMEKMFNKASKFSHKLNDWKLEKQVKNANFGLPIENQPQWAKLEATKPTSSASTPTNISPRSEQTAPSVVPTPLNNQVEPTNPNNNVSSPENSMSEVDMNSNIVPTENDSVPVLTPQKSEENIESKKQNESNIEKTNNLEKPTNVYKIPLAKPNAIISSKSSSAGVIAGSVLGTFIILGVGAGVGYYYRDPLKSSFFKSKDWIKDKISKIKSK